MLQQEKQSILANREAREAVKAQQAHGAKWQYPKNSALEPSQDPHCRGISGIESLTRQIAANWHRLKE